MQMDGSNSSTVDENLHKYKVIVVGESGVGKTCLTFRYCDGRFPEDVCSTIGTDFRKKIVNTQGKRILLHLWDTAGQERFHSSMLQHYFRNADAVVFVYDITSQSSLLKLKYWIDQCAEHNLTPEHVPCIIVGNKCDDKLKRAVSSQSAMMFADGYSMPHFETSAMADSENDHVHAIFESLALTLAKRKTESQQEGFKLEVAEEKQSSSSWGCC